MLNNMKLGTKLIWAFLIVAALCAFVGIFGAINLARWYRHTRAPCMRTTIISPLSPQLSRVFWKFELTPTAL